MHSVFSGHFGSFLFWVPMHRDSSTAYHSGAYVCISVGSTLRCGTGVTDTRSYVQLQYIAKQASSVVVQYTLSAAVGLSSSLFTAAQSCLLEAPLVQAQDLLNCTHFSLVILFEKTPVISRGKARIMSLTHIQL